MYISNFKFNENGFDLTNINKQITNMENRLSLYSFDSDSYKKAFKTYKELIHLRSEIIAQEERLVAIYKATHYDAIISNEKQVVVSEDNAYNNYMKEIVDKP